MWRFSIRAVVIYEGTKKVLVTSYRFLPGASWKPRCVDIWLGCRAVHLHAVLSRDGASQKIAV